MEDGPPIFKQGFSCPALLWILLCVSEFRLPGFHRLWLAFPKPFSYPSTITSAVRNPEPPKRFGLACYHFARRYFGNRVFFLFLSLLRCFSSRRLPPYDYFIHHTVTGLFPAGFPHSDIPVSMTVCVSTRLFAAFYVLHRLLAPRHPPFALYCLTKSLTSFHLFNM